MDTQQLFALGQQSLYLFLKIVMPLLLVVLAVGVIVSILQAATQINESTLSFIPKLIAAIVALGFAGPWMISSLVDYLREMLGSIPSVVR